MSYLQDNIEDFNFSLEENKQAFSSAHLEYVQEVLPFHDKHILIDRIDELNSSIPPKAIDSNKEISDLIAPYKEGINPIYLEAPQDSVQIEQISETMTRIEGLEFSEWKELSFNERVDVLQRVENEVSQIAHRPSCPIQTESLGKGYFGYYSPESQMITINSDYIKSNNLSDYKEVLDTIFHEGRHAAGDSTEIVVFQLLVFGSLMPHQGASCEQQVGACRIQAFVYQKVFLFPS